MAFPVHREQGLAPRPRSQSKWYFIDPALARIASAFGAGTAPAPSALSEQQLAVTLLRALEERNAWGRAFQTIEASGRSTGVVATRSGLRRHDGGWALPAGFVAFLLEG